MKYNSPKILKIKYIQLYQDLLAGSVVSESTTVESTGQEVVDYDFSDNEFNQEWY